MGDQSNDPAQFLTNLFQAGQDLMRQFTQPAADAGTSGSKPDPVAAFTAASRHLVELQQVYSRQMLDFWFGLFGAVPSGQPDTTPKSADRRFTAEAWHDDPRFDLLKRTYLAYSSFLQDAVDRAPLEEKTKGRLRFAVTQHVDAMSPANFLATNPEAQQLAQETGGQSLIEGMSLFLTDLAKGRISVTDENAFEVGRHLAVTEGAVVFENDLMQVIQYAPRTEEVYERPLLIVPPCINRFYILDLQPENSFVRYAVDQGHTVFLVSWRSITPEVGHFTWDDYLELGVMKGIDVALEVSGAGSVNTLGFCVGGTLLGSALAVQAATGRNRAASLTLLTTLLDFTDAGELGLLVSAETVGAREEAIGKGGVMAGKELAFVFSTLRANDLIWQYVVNSYLKGKSPPAFDLLAWNSDAPNLAGPMFCWYLRNTYLENNLRVPGKTVQCGVPVDLSRIDVPAFLYASREDHIVPWGAAYASTRLLKGEHTFVLGASGHIAGVINPPGKSKRHYWVGGVLEDDPQRWLATAERVPGSWWPAWSAWLAQHAGPKVAARSVLGSATHPMIEPAPGRYVLARVE